MKKGPLFLLFLLTIPIVEATISIDGPTRDKYNLGDKVEVAGYILATDAVDGLFSLNLDCDSSMQLFVKSVSLGTGEKYDFSENLLIPTFLDGTCRIKAVVTSNDIIMEEGYTRDFSITKELNGNFSMDETQIQMGKDIVLNGKIFKLSGDNINGLATLYFKKDGKNYFIDTIDVVDGNLRYTTGSSDKYDGFYAVDIGVNDVNGNQQLFENIVSFTLVCELYVIAKADKLNVFPGSTVNIFGEVKTILQEKVREVNVTIIFNEKKYETKLEKSKFSYDLEIPKDIATGKYKVVVRVVDSLGNKGETDTSIDVDPMPTRLANKFNNESFKPEETVVITPLLYDQTNNLVEDEEISVEVIDPKKKNIFSGVTKSNETIEFILPKSSVPGTYTVKTYSAGLSYEDKLYVGEFARIEFTLDNQTLYAKNTGNVRYKKPIEIRVKSLGESYTIIRKTPLGIDQILDIDLGEEVPSGKYDVVAGNSTFKNVIVVGKPKQDFGWIYYIITALVVGIFFYLLFFKVKAFKISKIKNLKIGRLFKRRQKEKEEKEIREKVLKDIGEVEKKKQFKFKPKKTYEEVVIEEPKEERTEIVIEKPEEKEKEKEKEEPTKKGGLFNMFD